MSIREPLPLPHVCVVGSGAREHALALFLARDAHVTCIPGNAALTPRTHTRIRSLSLPESFIPQWCKENQIDLVVIGPDAALERGLADVCRQLDIPTFGPNRDAARLEWDKAWAKDFMVKHHIPTARFVTVNTLEKCKESLKEFSFPVVVKASGLAQGKGVFICKTLEEALENCRQLLEEKILGNSGATLVIEEFLQGFEVSYFVLVSNENFVPFTSAQDFKRRFEKNEGPNTGGMGAIAPHPFFTSAQEQEVLNTIVKPLVDGLHSENISYQGMLFVGLMVTENGIKVLEFNARFGDPETQVILPLLEDSLFDLLTACAQNKLDNVDSVSLKSVSACGVVLVSPQYPEPSPQTIQFPPLRSFANYEFYANVKSEMNGLFSSKGGRCVTLVCVQNNILEAIQSAYDKISYLNAIPFDYRKDIGKDVFKEECAVVAISGTKINAQYLAHLGLFALQHRGQESSGIATLSSLSSTSPILIHKNMGLVSQVYSQSHLEKLAGNHAIGHNRYSTTGDCRIENAQPLYFESSIGPFALAHNGNIKNSDDLRKKVEEYGVTLNGSTDSEIIGHLISLSPAKTWDKKIEDALSLCTGAFCLVILTQEGVFVARDPLGFRPLSLGRHPETQQLMVASETCALQAAGFDFVEEVAAGTLLFMRECEVVWKKSFAPLTTKKANCIFETVYFSRADSEVGGKSIYESRQDLGRFLAQEHPVPHADIIVGVPDSAVPAARAYAEALGLPFADGLLKNRYIARTFIEPTSDQRWANLLLKFAPLASQLRHKKVVLIDDSIVRGNTMKALVKLLKDFGASEVHVRSASPAVKFPCYFGININSKKELIASQNSVDEICTLIGADSLAYLSLDSLVKSTENSKEDVCTACFSGEYPC